ncbi:M56 family metallopeptidase [Coraliomargarita sp. SDUM461003]|uniref:M56 family metallopeptidase n=1 Tax=Thalassobacterium maritimum TaxID=3041265 RepID=A0ABU1AY10_9BACT|nr:M56 family metallopeptidase [Coraliomargarita sp. SDUM461003]MDQ8207862.1 M56 family metallopeptidase [Coraliomargarita sp. SDUM461003]
MICASLPVGLAILTTSEDVVSRSAPPQPTLAAAAAASPSLMEGASEEPVMLAEIDAWQSLGEVEERRRSWAMYVFACLVLGTVVGMVRVIASVRGARNLRRDAEPIECVELAVLSERIGLRRMVPVLKSGLCQVPAVCGLFKPVILLPLSQLTALNPEHIEAILAHELAHIKRCDPIVNFLQLIAEAFLFFNPFLWWVSGQVRQEREAACDAMAVEATGQRSIYVQALTEVAAGQLVPADAAQLSFAGDAKSGTLLDRVKRLLRPTSSPELRLRMPMLCLIFVGVFSVAVLLQWTARSAVKALTPDERIEQVNTVHEVYPQYAVESFDQDVAASKPLILSGQALCPDGTPPAGTVQIYCYSRFGRGSMLSSEQARHAGRFDFIVKPGDVSLLVLAEGWAPLYVDLGTVRETQREMKFQLQEGYNAQLRLMDSGGEPISNAKVDYQWDVGPSGRLDSAEADANGLVQLEDLGDLPLKVSCRIAGYQEMSLRDLRLQPGEVYDLVLQPSQPLRLHVHAAESGEALAGAQVEVLSRDFSAGMHMAALGAEKPIVSSVEGVAVMNTLNDAGRYYFGVSKPGYMGEIVGPCLAGEDVSLDLKPRPVLSFQVAGVPDSLLDAEGKVEYTISYSFSYEDHTSSGRERETMSAAVQDGVLQFEFSPKWRSQIDLKLGEIDLSFQPGQYLTSGAVQASLGASAIDPALEYVLRPVEVRFQTPVGEPLAEGRLSVRFDQSPIVKGQARRRTQRLVEVVAGVAQFELPVPNQIELEPEGLRGYWFEREYRIEVPSSVSSEPFIHEVETQRAGAIAGRILEPDGSVPSNLLIGVFETENSNEQTKRSSLSIKVKNASSSHDQDNEFLASPLPLGGSYVISASRGYTHLLSESIDLTEALPVRRIRMEMPVGETISGRVINERGEAIAMATTQFSFEPNEGHSFSRSGPRTDREGRFRLDSVNSEVEGTYYITVDSVAGYQPIKSRLNLREKEQVIQLKPGHRMSGVVIEAGTGKVIPGAEVYASRSEYQAGAFPFSFDAELTDAQGRFEFTNLPPGEFKVASRSGRMASGYEAIAHTDRDEVVEVKIELYEWEKLVPVEVE